MENFARSLSCLSLNQAITPGKTYVLNIRARLLFIDVTALAFPYLLLAQFVLYTLYYKLFLFHTELNGEQNR